MILRNLFVTGLLLTGCSLAIAEEVAVQSPDGGVVMAVNDDDGLSYSVSLDGKNVILDSELALELANGTELGRGFSISSILRTSSNSYWNPVQGKKTTVQDHYNQLEIKLSDGDSQKVVYLVCRAYDDGAAFRYRFDSSFGSNELNLKEEKDQFVFTGDNTCWPAFLNSYKTEHQALYPKSTLSAISPGDLVGPPFTMKVADDLYCCITEAALKDWAGMYLTRNGKVDMLYESKKIDGGQDAVKFFAKIPAEAQKIQFEIDSVDGNSFDHVDIVNLKFIDTEGKVTWLTDLEPTYARQDWSSLKKNKSVDGNTLTIAEKQYSRGFGSHSNGTIVFDKPEGVAAISGSFGIDSEVGEKGSAKLKISTLTSKNGSNSLVSSLSRIDDNPTVKVQLPALSPWRVIMVGRKAVDLVNSDIVKNLNEPCKVADTSWIKAGVSSWNWLSCGNYMDMPLLKGFVDLSSAMGWDYVLVDDGWYSGWDCLHPIEGLNIPELVEYAKTKNVKVWVWVHWYALDPVLDEAMALYKQWGVVGIKTDFMSRDDQWMVNWYHKVLASAAKNHIMVNYHGCYKATGINRTWPNLMTREAIYGNEQNLGTGHNDPVHKATLPFTRMLGGTMDHTPGSFLNANRDTFRPQRPVMTLGTRAQELAICLIYDSGLISMADKPENYYGQAGLDYLKNLPATWDDTIVLDGQIGEYIATVRKTGDSWYLGAMTDWNARSLYLDLSFLDAGEYEVTMFADGPDADNNACDIQKSTFTVTASDKLNINMVSGGGAAAIIRKK